MTRYLYFVFITLMFLFNSCNGKEPQTSNEGNDAAEVGLYKDSDPSKAIIGNLVFNTISDSTVEVGNNELLYVSLEHITIPSKVDIEDKEYTVTQIGYNAFSNCKKLKNVKLSPTITSILKNAFYGCESLVDIEIPKSVVFIGDQAFMGCCSLSEIKLPSNLTEINNGVFCMCTNLISFEISPNVTDIGRGAFCLCSNLKNIDIPSNVQCILCEAFYGCDNLEPKLLIYNNGERCYGWIGKEEYCTDIEIPNGVLYIGDAAFNSMSHLKSVKIPTSVKNIGFEAFKECHNLTHIDIPSSVTHIFPEAFYNCSNLDIVIDNSKKNVNVDYASFEGCKSVTWLKD